jgi:hypothetical protein
MPFACLINEANRYYPLSVEPEVRSLNKPLGFIWSTREDIWVVILGQRRSHEQTGHFLYLLREG